MNDKTWLGTIAQIKQWRIKHNISQRAMANAAGVSRNTYASWERRNTVLGGAECIKINKAIFAWGENDYVTVQHQPTEQQVVKPETTQSILYRLGRTCGKIVRWIIKAFKK